MNKYYIYAAVCIGLYGAGYYFGKGDKKIVYKERIEYVVNENIKERIVQKPDGTIITERESVRSEVGSIDTEKTVTPNGNKWRVTMMGSYESDKDADSVYTLSVTHKLLPNLYAGLYGRTDKEFGLSIGFSF